MSATTSASARVFASVAIRASGAARPRVAVLAPTVSAPAKSARLGPERHPGRGAKLVVRADGEGLDRDAFELQEKFAIIGACVLAATTRVFDAARLLAGRPRARFIRKPDEPDARTNASLTVVPNLAASFRASRSASTSARAAYTYVPKNGDDFYPVAGTQSRTCLTTGGVPRAAEKSKFKNMGKEVVRAEPGHGFAPTR